MHYYIDTVRLFTDEQLGRCWRWFDSLNTEEWFVLLGITAMLGFLCLRGMGTQKGA